MSNVKQAFRDFFKKLIQEFCWGGFIFETMNKSVTRLTTDRGCQCPWAWMQIEQLEWKLREAAGLVEVE
jgi:hypothetical protein